MNGKFGVGDGVRTRDIQNHNLELYQAELRPPHAEEENKGSWRQERGNNPTYYILLYF